MKKTEEISLKNIALESLTWHAPAPKSPFAVTIPNQNEIRFNRKLTPELPPCVELGTDENGTHLGIRASEGGYRVPKSGNIKAQDVIAELRAAGVKLPARYVMARVEGGWLGTLVKTPEAAFDLKKTPRSPKKKDLSGLVGELAEK